MKVRLTTFAGALLVAVAVSACTPSGPGSSFPSIPTSHPSTPTTSSTPHAGDSVKTSPQVTAPTTATSTAKSSATGTARATGTATATRTATATGTATATRTASASGSASATRTASSSASASPRVTHSSTHTARSVPSGAPQTGGGGTAGLQDGALFGIGALAVAAGLASLAYRRRLTKTR
jgi:hypothetical protein